MSKIISYCIFGEEQFYRRGLTKNIKLAAELFPEWICRIYAESTLDKNYLSSLERENTEIIIKEKPTLPLDALHWRWLPMEEGHEAVIIRDVDTRLFQRDVNLVRDWLKNGKQYHVCRDHPGHKDPIMGGLWGGKYPKIEIKKLWDRYLRSNTKLISSHNKFANDQYFLSRYIYPLIRKNLTVYTEHNIFIFEEDVRRISGPRGTFEGRPVILGVQPKQDFSEEDEQKRKEYFKSDYLKNEERRIHMSMTSEEMGSESPVINVSLPPFLFSNIFGRLFYGAMKILIGILKYKLKVL